MGQIFINMIDLPPLYLLNADLNYTTGEVKVTIGHERVESPVFAVEVVFLGKTDDAWETECIFYKPVEVELSADVRFRMRYYITDLFGDILETYITKQDPLNELGEDLERELAHMSI